MNAALAFDLAWKSGLVAAIVLAAVGLLRPRPAAERVALLRLGLLVVLALPLLTIAVPALRVQIPTLARFEPVPGPAANVTPIPGPAPNAAPTPDLPAGASPVRSDPQARAMSLPHISPLAALAAIWLAGVTALTLRLLGGVAALALWTRRAAPVTDPLWRAALDRAVDGGRPPRLKVSARIASPLSWSWPRGVILIDKATLSRPDRADAVLTHEMGHVRHHDWLFLMLSHVLVAVLWFNPFVWRLQKELARQSEQAADAWAVRRIDRVDYAGALVAMARSARPHAALGMAGPSSDLARRVIAVLDPSQARGRPWTTAVAAIACVGMAGPLAALEWKPEAVSPDARHPADAPARGAAVASAPPAAASVAQPAEGLSPEALGPLARQREPRPVMMQADALAMEAPTDAGARPDIQADLDPRPMPLPMPLVAPLPSPPGRDEEAAGLRTAARRLRIDATRIDADALRIEQEGSRSEEVVEHAGDLRDQASELRQEADDLDREAADVMSG